MALSQGRETAPAAPADPQSCSIARALEVIGDRWTILVLRDCFKGIRRFDEIRRDLDIARPVLADRLRRLVDHGVLEKRLYQERPNRYEYRLTQMGRELSPILVALMRWGDHYLAGEAGPPTLLVHKPCGHELLPGLLLRRVPPDVLPGRDLLPPWTRRPRRRARRGGCRDDERTAPCPTSMTSCSTTFSRRWSDSWPTPAGCATGVTAPG